MSAGNTTELNIDLNYEVIDNSYISITGIYDNTQYGVLTIPPTITHNSIVYEVQNISAGSFDGILNITSVAASNSNLITISRDAFSQCVNITSINLQNSTKLLSIGSSAFYNNLSNTSVNLSGCSSLEILYTSCFEINVFLTTIDFTDCYRLNTIGDNCFATNFNLNSITFGSRLQPTIGTNIFLGINSSAIVNAYWWSDFGETFGDVSVNILYDDLSYEIKSGGDSLSDVSYASLKAQYLTSSSFNRLRQHLDNSYQINADLYLPEDISGYPLKQLQYSAFYDPLASDMSINKLVVPDTVIDINANAFAIEDGVDLVDRSLSHLLLPIGSLDATLNGTSRNRLTPIRNNFIKNQARIEEIYFPDTIDTLGNSIFSGVSSLQNIFFAGDILISIHDNTLRDISCSPTIYINPWTTTWSSTFTDGNQNATLDVSINLNNSGLEYYSETLTLNEDTSLNITFTATDFSDISAAIIYSIPANGTLYDIFDNSINVTNGHYVLPTDSNFVKYSPTTDFSGIDSFRYYLLDPDRTFVEYHEISLNVVNTYDGPPLAEAQSINITEDISATVTLTATDANGGIFEPSYFTFWINTYPTYGSLYDICNNNKLIPSSPSELPYELSGNQINYDPDPNIGGIDDSFNFYVVDLSDASSNIATIDLAIIAVNDAPIANSLAFDVSENITFTIDLSAGISDVDDPFLYIS